MEAVLSRLRFLTLSRSSPISAEELRAAAGEDSHEDPMQPVCGRLIRHLLLNFLLWVPAGHAAAHDTITLVSVHSCSPRSHLPGVTGWVSYKDHGFAERVPRVPPLHG